MKNTDPLFASHRRVWALAGPMIVSNISTPLVGMVDTAVVGHMTEPDAIGAVALGALIFSFLFWGFGFLKMGTTGFIAQAHGANDQSQFLNTLARVLLLALVLGFLVLLLSRPLIQFALFLLEGSAQVERLTADYAAIRIWSAPATLCSYAFIGIFIGIHNTRFVLIQLLVLNVSNMLLDVLFVLGFEWGIHGVAWASLIAEYLAAICGFYLLRHYIYRAWQYVGWSSVLAYESLLKLMQANSDIFIRTLCLVFSFSYFTAQSAKMGAVVLAANAILLHLQSIVSFALDGFAHAAEALTGSAYGAKKRGAFQHAVKITSVWAFIVAVCLVCIYWLLGEWILSLFTDIDTVLASAKTYLPWMIITPLVSVWSFQLDGIFIGISATKAMRNAMLVSTFLYLLLLQVLLPALANHGLFLALSLFMLLRALTLAWYYPKIVRQMA